jgi:hypothetical protein
MKQVQLSGMTRIIEVENKRRKEEEEEEEDGASMKMTLSVEGNFRGT